MTETYTIHNGSWVPMTRCELMDLPWFHEAAKTGELLLINSCIGFQIGEIQEGGSFLDTRTKKPLYIMKNTKRRTRLRLNELVRDGDEWKVLNTSEIYRAQLASDELVNGFRCAITTGKRYCYDETGELD